ncbi:hypothetical protein [Kocuria aegyptia]|uniref:MFS transporter n=1 Tax=Kocuria aegyptia TaxID=330943 RepID=A0ABN2KEF9_9MICC
MEQRAPLRLARALLVTAVVLALAAVGHLAGGGGLPPLIVLIGLAAGVLGPVTWASGRRLTLGPLLVLLGVAQWGLHEAFLLTSTVPACAAVPDSHHSTHLGPDTACPTGLVLEAGHHGPSGHGAAMLAGHVLAVLVIALVITRAEAALWLALEWLRPLLGLVRPTGLPAAARSLMPAAEQPVLAWRGLRRDRVRGPPAAGVLRAIDRV